MNIFNFNLVTNVIQNVYFHFQILIRSGFQWTNSHSVEVPLQIPKFQIPNSKLAGFPFKKYERTLHGI